MNITIQIKNFLTTQQRDFLTAVGTERYYWVSWWWGGKFIGGWRKSASIGMHFFEGVNSRTELPPTLGSSSLVNTLGRVLKPDGAQVEVSSTIDGDSNSKKEVDEEDDATGIENARENNNDDTVDSGESK